MSKMTLEQIVAVIEKAWENHDEDGRVILTMKNAQDIMEAIHHLSKTAERIKADEAAQPTKLEDTWTGEIECCDSKGFWLILADDCPFVPGQKVTITAALQENAK